MFDWKLLVLIQVIGIIIAAFIAAKLASRPNKRDTHVNAELDDIQESLTALTVRVGSLENDREASVQDDATGGILLSGRADGSVPGGRSNIRGEGVRSSGKEREGSDR